MRLRLQPSSDFNIPIWFDAFGLFACMASPSEFSPNADKVFDNTKIGFLIGEQSDVEVLILDESLQTIRTLLQEDKMQKGFHLTTWDGTTDEDFATSPGTYHFRIRINNELSNEITLTSPVYVQDPYPLEGSIKEFPDFFPRGLWLHLGGRYGQNLDYDSVLSLFKQAMFNTIIPSWYPEERIPELMNIADKYDLRVIAHTPGLDSLIVKYPDFFFEKVKETEIRDMATTYVAQLASHPSLLGYYIRDEIGTEYLEPANFAVRTLRGMDPDHPAFSSIQSVSDLKERFNALDTAVLLHHYYSMRFAHPIAPEIFDGFCLDLEKASEAARDKNRPLWVMLQGFSDENSRRVPTPEEMRCQLWIALAYGAKGIFYFVSNSFYQIHGALSYEGNPFPIFETMKQLNPELEKLSPMLLNLLCVEAFATAPQDHTLGCFEDSGKTAHVIIVNKDCLTTKSSELIFHSANVTGVEDVLTSESFSFYYEAGQTHVPLTLFPGEGRLLRINTNSDLSAVPRRIPREALFSALSLPSIPFLEEYVPYLPPRQIPDETVISHVPLDGLLNRLSVENGYAYIAALERGLHVVDVKRPWDPRWKETRTDLHYYADVFASERGVFCSDPRGGVTILDWDEKDKLEEIGTWWGNTGSPYSLSLQEDRAYLASDRYGISLLDVTDPTSPILISRGEPVERARCVIPNGEIAYLLDEFKGIHVEDISTSNITRLKTTSLNSPISGEIRGELLAVACGRYGVKLFSISDPENPEQTGEIPLTYCESVGFWREGWLFAAAGLDGIAIIKITEQGTPVLQEYHQPVPGYFARALKAKEYCLYVLYPYAGLYMISPKEIFEPGVGRDFQGFYFY